METKNNSLSGSVNRNFALLGDPSMRLAIPQLDVSIDAVTSQEVPVDTLNALAKIKITGSIRDKGNGIVQDFEGKVNISLMRPLV